MPSAPTTEKDALARAKKRLAEGKLTSADLDALWQAAAHAMGGSLSPDSQARQWILYIHASHPTVVATVLNATLYEPDADKTTQLDPLAQPLPYKSVRDAVIDGWRVVQFPNQRDAFDDREVDIIGYEFILEKFQPAT